MVVNVPKRATCCVTLSMKACKYRMMLTCGYHNSDSQKTVWKFVMSNDNH